MPLSKKKLLQSVKLIGQRRQALLNVLSGTQPVIAGTVYDVYRRCGNPYCHCAGKPGHLQTLLICMEKGRRRCKFIRQRDVDRVRQAWERYKNCKKALQEIRALNNRELALLRAQIQLRSISYK